MQAIVQDRFGAPEVLELAEVPEPQAGDDEVLVRVRAASVNPADWYAMSFEQAAAVGADQVVDYTREDFTRTGRRYDLLLHVAGSRPWTDCARVLHPRATLVLVGAPKGSRLLGPLGHIGRVRLASLRASQRVVFFISKVDHQDLMTLQELLEAGTVTPVVERTYPLAETAAALRYLGEGHARGKLVVTM
jgi:NADPH:quinone reductase-like Zn-dependent oxidoreductase